MSPHPRTTPFPYTTLFRSAVAHAGEEKVGRGAAHGAVVATDDGHRRPVEVGDGDVVAADERELVPERDPALRSEEHTSELQSHVNLVCRLLLEKKNKTSTT